VPPRGGDKWAIKVSILENRIDSRK
jgi:hypothetical protein